MLTQNVVFMLKSSPWERQGFSETPNTQHSSKPTTKDFLLASVHGWSLFSAGYLTIIAWNNENSSRYENRIYQGNGIIKEKPDLIKIKTSGNTTKRSELSLNRVEEGISHFDDMLEEMNSSVKENIKSKNNPGTKHPGSLRYYKKNQTYK